MRRAASALLALAALLAGCATPAPHAHEPGALDTGPIAPGAEATLRFEHAGTATVHCHPHPWMEQRVDATPEGPPEAHVHVLDGDAPDTYRFEPATLSIAPGGTVTYHNHGTRAHTATVET